MIDPRIFYVIAVPDWKPEQATPLQGFAPSLCRNEWMIRAISALPATIFDMTEKGRKTLIQRRMLGERSIYWHGQSPRSIVSSHVPENTPFFLVLLGEGEPVAEYMDWSAKNGDKPTIVAEKGAHLSYPDLTLNGLKERLLAVCDRLGSAIPSEDVAEAKSLIAQWQAFDKRALGYKVGGHNSVAPNVHVLESIGFTDISYGPLGVSFEIQPHVNQIVQTTRSIFAERDRLGVNRLARFFKPTFELNLFSPAIYPDVLNMNVPTSLGTEERDRFIIARRLLQEQTGYSYSSRSAAHAQAILGIGTSREHNKKSEFSPHPLFRLRQEELWLGTACMIGFAVSETSAVVRLPNAVNRTSGAVHNFAEHYRSKSPVTRKRLRAFQEVQSSIAKAVPSEFVDLIREARTGVRIVADAHLEWLDIDGLPLGIRKDVTRIPVTPGNSFIDHLCAYPPTVLTPKDFEQVLVVSAMEEGGPLHGVMQKAIEGFEKRWDDRIHVHYVEVASEEELVAALNDFNGALVIFDGHGGHDSGDSGKLYLKGVPVDIWNLDNRLRRVPPIVLLSACDTQRGR